MSSSSPGVLCAIETSADILALATALLRLCRDEIESLARCDGDPRTWRRRDRLRRDCEALFREIDDEEIDQTERQRLADLARPALAGDDDPDLALPEVAVAHTVAEALDAALGDRFLPMFLNRTTAVREGDPLPTPHPDWRNLTPSPNSDPWTLDGRLDGLPHLRLASGWARQVKVTLDGSWRTWHLLPQLAPGDRLACAVPNESLGEFTWQRDTCEGRPVFFDFRPRAGHAEQTRRCIELLVLAGEQRCRVVVFPELCAPTKTVSAMARWLNRQERVDLVVAGSRHRRVAGGRWHNEAQILIRGLRRRLHHRKFRPYSFLDPGAEKKATRRYEHLHLGPPKLSVWLSPRWAMTTLICKDSLQAPVPMLLGEARVNLVLVPCLSFKMEAFRTVAGDVATWAQGVALMANAAFAASARGRRQPVVVGLPSQSGSVFVPTPPPRSVVVVFFFNDTATTEIYTVPTIPKSTS